MKEDTQVSSLCSLSTPTPNSFDQQLSTRFVLQGQECLLVSFLISLLSSHAFDLTLACIPFVQISRKKHKHLQVLFEPKHFLPFCFLEHLFFIPSLIFLTSQNGQTIQLKKGTRKRQTRSKATQNTRGTRRKHKYLSFFCFFTCLLLKWNAPRINTGKQEDIETILKIETTTFTPFRAAFRSRTPAAFKKTM